MEEGHHKNIKIVKIIYNDILKSTNDDAGSIIDPLYKKENNVT
jgi:hypothetical protein